MAQDHQFKLTTQSGLNTSDPNADSLLKNLTLALEGGDTTFDLFSGNIQALHNLYQTIATGGDSVWLDGTDEDGNPVSYIDNGNHFLSVGAQVHDRETLQNGTGSTTNYKEVGTAYVTLTTDQGTSIQTLMIIHYAGIGIAGIGLTGPVFKILKPLVKSAVNFLKNLASKIYNKVQNGETTDDTDDAEDTVDDEASTAAEEAGEEGAEVGEGIFADVSFGIADGVGVVVAVGAIAVVLILALLKKQMTNYVRFYNATDIDLQFGLCYTTGSTGTQIAPAKVGETIAVKKISPAPTPPWVTSTDTVIYRSDLQFINNNELKGIGYVATAKPSGDFPGFKVMVDIPNSGDNSLYIGFEDGDCSSVYDQHSGDNTALTASVTSGKYKLQIATNRNSGQSPSPIDSTEGYNYEHLIVLTDGTVNI